MTVNAMRVLTVSGSLRGQSTNTELLRALRLVASSDISVTLFEGLASLPAFNPDLDAEGMTPPTSVEEWRNQVVNAHALVICSPEYAHGVPGSLKNALDWLVSVPEMLAKPVALVNASPRSTHAQVSLAETLRTMSVHLVGGTSWLVPVQRGMTSSAIAADLTLAASLRSCLAAVAVAISNSRPAPAVPEAPRSFHPTPVESA
jgi:chromate reductase